MFAYAIPAATTLLVGTHIEPITQNIQKKIEELTKRFAKVNEHYNDIEVRTKGEWNATTLSYFTTIALGIPEVSELNGQNGVTWGESLQAARANFDTTLGEKSLQKSPAWLTKLWIISIVAQAIVCYKNPLTNFVRIASLTATCVFPLMFFGRMSNALQNHSYYLKTISKYVNSYPVINHSRFNQFVFNKTRYRTIDGSEFIRSQLTCIASSLVFNSQQLSEIPGMEKIV